MPKRIFISGASRGIGKALALAYAQEGAILGLLARNEELLKNTKELCQKKGALVYTYIADIQDLNSVQKSVRDFLEKAQGIDVVIANAGIATGPSMDGVYPTEQLCRVLKTNTCGAIYLINEFLPKILEQKKGHIVAISSVAAYLPFLPGTYSASKIALNYYLEGLRLRHKSPQIHFTVICPGYILTDMTAKRKNLPFALPVEVAAVKIKKAIQKEKPVYIFPAVWKIVILMSRILPRFVIQRILK